MEINEYLKYVYIFKDLDDVEINYILPFMTIEQFDDTEVIFLEGNPCRALFVLADGIVKITKRIDEKKEKTLTQIQPTYCFGEMAMLDGNVRSASAKSVGKTTLISFSKSGFDKIVQDHSETAVKILMRLSILLSKRLRETNEQMIDFLQMGIR